MTNPTALPIARLRALGCKVSTVLGHDVPSPLSGRLPHVRAAWRYSITLPVGIGHDAFDGLGTWHGLARASWHAGQQAIIVEAYQSAPAPEYSPTAFKRRSLQGRISTAQDVAGLLSSLADVLNGRKP